MITVSQCITNAEAAIRMAEKTLIRDDTERWCACADSWMALADTISRLEQPEQPTFTPDYSKPDIAGLAS